MNLSSDFVHFVIIGGLQHLSLFDLYKSQDGTCIIRKLFDVKTHKNEINGHVKDKKNPGTIPIY